LASVRILYTLAYGCPRVYKPDGRGGIVGGLNMTRSIGDLQLKPQVSHEPDVVSRECQIGEFVITATDGVWDELSPEEVGNIVRMAEESVKKHRGREPLPLGEGETRIRSEATSTYHHYN